MVQSKIIDTLETYQASPSLIPARPRVGNDKNKNFDVEFYLTYLSMYFSLLWHECSDPKD